MLWDSLSINADLGSNPQILGSQSTNFRLELLRFGKAQLPAQHGVLHRRQLLDDWALTSIQAKKGFSKKRLSGGKLPGGN
jgi:hypothetical protein